MKKAIIKSLSVVLAVVLTFSAAPLGGLVGLELPEWLDFSVKSSAAAYYDYFNYSQTHVVSNYSSKYDDYEAMYFDGYATAMDGTDGTIDYCIPGLQSGEEMIPQGITYYAEKDWILISAYNKAKDKNSVIYALDRKTGNHVAEFEILKNNDEFTGHLGGIAASDYNLYMSYGGSIAYIPLSSFDVSVGTAICLNIEASKSLSSQLGEANVSYVTITDGVLYAGNFYNETDDYDTRASSGYASVVVGYSLSGTDSQNEWDNLKLSSPSYKYNISDDSGIIAIQSATVKNGYLYLSCSYGRNYDSELIIIAVGNNTSMVCETALYTCNALPMMEGIVFIDDGLYVIFESASDYYFNSLLDKSENPTDVVWKVDYRKVFSEVLNTCGDNLTWEFDESTGTLTISGAGAMDNYEKDISQPWYIFSSNIKTVVINNGVTTIGEGAFFKCANLINVSVPDSVTTIGEGAFCMCTSLTNVIIPDSVTTIGDIAFGECDSLTNVTIPDSVTTMGQMTFAMCDKLEIVTIGNSVTTIDYATFFECTSLTDVMLENGVTNIGNSAFLSCTSLTSITIPDSVTTIDVGAFGQCTSLKTVTIPNSVTTIGEGAFCMCTSLTNVIIPDSVTTIGDIAFGECTSLKSVTIPNSVTTIGAGAFFKCENLEYVIIGNGVTTIGDAAFGYCTSLTSITIPDGVTTIGLAPFAACTSLTSIIVDSNNHKYTSNEDGVLFNNEYTVLIQYPNGNPRTSYTIPNSVVTVGNGAFGYSTNLTAVTIPDNLITIGKGAFEECTALADVYYSGTEERWNTISIGEGNDLLLNTIIHFTGAVEHTHSYTVVITAPTCSKGGYTTYTCTCGDSYVADDVAAIGHTYIAFKTEPSCTEQGYTIYQCSSCGDQYSADYVDPIGHTPGTAEKENIVEPICETDGSYDNVVYCSVCWEEISRETIVVPATGHDFVDRVCQLCGLTDYPSGTCGDNLTWEFNTSTGTLTISGTGLMYDYEFNNQPWNDYIWRDIKNVVINNGVTTIGNNAFYWSENLASVTIPDSVISIGDYAFGDCPSLKNITIPNSVAIIGYDAFAYCISLTSVTIPDSVTTIGDGAFDSCTSLAEVTIGNGVTTIGNNAFFYCDSITSITVDSNNQYYSSDDFGVLFNKDKTTLIKYPIGNARTSYTIPDSVTTIGEYAFYSCSSLTSVTISDSVTTIGNNAFSSCSVLESVAIGDGVTVIGACAFIYCDSLTSVIIPDSVTTIGDGAFMGCDSLTSATIGDGVTIIGYEAFCYNDNLTSVTIPDSVSTIDDRAFSDCNNLTDVYYSGTEEEWNEISIGSENECLTNATIHFNHSPESELSFSLKTDTDSLVVGDKIIVEVEVLKNDGWGTLTFDVVYDPTVLKASSVKENPYGATYKLDYENNKARYVAANSGVNTDTGTIFKIEFEVISSEDCEIYVDFLEATDNDWNNMTVSCNKLYLYADFCSMNGHNYTSVVTPPKCTEQGYTTYICSVCGDSYTSDETPATGHEFVDGVCSVCGKTTSSDSPVVEASFYLTSTDDSLVVGDTITVEVGISKNPGLGALTFDVLYDPTVLKPSSVQENPLEGIHNIKYAENKVRYVVASAIEITNTGTVLTIEFEVLKSEDCEVYIDFIEVTDDYWNNITVGCNKLYLYADSCNSNGHNFSDWAIKIQPVCWESGLKIRTCTECGVEETEEIPATGHNYIEMITEPTCTKTGCKTYTCVNCDDTYTEEIPSIGHNCTSIVTAPTCTKNGYTTFTCIVCNDSYKADETPATGHNFVNGTCTACGKTNSTNAPQIVVDSKLAMTGKEIKVAISLENNPGITSMLLNVNYDTTKLQLVSVDDCGKLGTSVHSNALGNPYTLSWANDTATENYTYNGEVVVLTFNVLEDAELGETSITVTYDYDNFDIIDKNMEPVEFETVEGIINIINVTIGDVNEDGKVNTLDRVILTRYIAKWEEYPEGSINTIAADVNGDGKVNTLDRVILTRYIAKWEGYETLPYSN